jgi:hypothetical protein
MFCHPCIFTMCNTIQFQIMWTIWRERNERCFEDHEKSKEELKNIWSNRSLIGQRHRIFPPFLTSQNMWIFVLLSAFSGDYLCINLMF